MPFHLVPPSPPSSFSLWFSLAHPEGPPLSSSPVRTDVPINERHHPACLFCTVQLHFTAWCLTRCAISDSESSTSLLWAFTVRIWGSEKKKPFPICFFLFHLKHSNCWNHWYVLQLNRKFKLVGKSDEKKVFFWKSLICYSEKWTITLETHEFLLCHCPLCWRVKMM